MIGNRVDVATDPTVQAVLHDLLDGTTRQRQDGCTARHGFNHDEAERLFPLNWKQERPGSGKQRILLRRIDLTDIFDLATVDTRSHLLVPVLAKDRLDLSGELESNSRTERRFNREMRGLAGRHTPEESDVIFFLRGKRIVLHRNPVMDDMQPQQTFAAGEPGPDRDVIDLGVPRVLLRERRFVRVMQRVHDWQIDESSEWYAYRVVHVQHVNRRCSILQGPCGMIEIFQLRSQWILDGPVGVRVTPFDAARQSGVAVRINRHLMVARVEAVGQIRDEELGTAVSGGRNGDERRSDEADMHADVEICKNASFGRTRLLFRAEPFATFIRAAWHFEPAPSTRSRSSEELNSSARQIG